MDKLHGQITWTNYMDKLYGQIIMNAFQCAFYPPLIVTDHFAHYVEVGSGKP
jgi:hypothetical protein